jgi:hypothetical protein
MDTSFVFVPLKSTTGASGLTAMAQGEGRGRGGGSQIRRKLPGGVCRFRAPPPLFF